MKTKSKFKKIILICIVCLAIILTNAMTVFYGRIAIVNLTKIVPMYSEAVQLNTEYKKQIQGLSNWVDNAKLEIDLEKQNAKKENLIHEYQEIANKRRQKIKSDYNKKLAEIEAHLSKVVKEIANKNWCRTVLTKDSVIQGGIDITEEVIKALKK